MFLYELIFATLCVLVIWLYLKWQKMKTFWVKKGIPQCPINLIFGSMTFLQKMNPSLWFAEIYKQYPSPYVGIWVFWRPGLIVHCPNIARNILVKDADIFRNRLAGTSTRHDLTALNLFTVNDPLWTSIRKRLSPVFTAAKLRGFQELYRSKSADLVQRIKSDNEKGVCNNLRTLYADYTTDVIGESAFGIKCEATKNGSGPLRAMTLEFEKFSAYRGIQWSSLFFFPELADLLDFPLWPKHTMEYFKRIFSTIVKERGGYEKETDGKKDLMDALLKMKQDAMKDGQNLDEVVVVSNALIFLQGGYDTTSTALAYITYELAYQPENQQRLYEEVMDAKSKTEGEFETNDLADLPFLNAVIKETLRKYPILGWIDRVALKDYHIDEQLTIPAGTAVFINANGMQHDPKLFPDPMEFKPERFLPENEKDIVPYTYMPFGEGPRACIGKRFGLNTMRYAIAAVIMNFQFKSRPGAPAPNDAAVEHNGLLYAPGELLAVEFVPRN